MLIDFFLHLKAAKLPVSTREFLTLLDALKHGVVSNDIDDFYVLARTCMVKDEALYDRFNSRSAAISRGWRASSTFAPRSRKSGSGK